jgi:putative DNA primase/helicase
MAKAKIRIETHKNGKRYQIKRAGIALVIPDSDPHHICGPIQLIENRLILGSNVVQIAIEFKDVSGFTKRIVVPRSEAHAPSRLMERLADHGWECFDPQATKIFLESRVRERPPQKSVFTALSPGWQTLPDSKRMVYVTNNDLYQTNSGKHNVVLVEGMEAGFASSGDLGDWNEHVGHFCIGNPLVQFAVCVMLASFVLRLTGFQNIGFHFAGPKKRCKTTALNVAASVVGSADNVKSWHSTANALEPTAMSRNDAVLILDEMGQGDPKDVSKAVYNLMNGQMKSTLTPDRKLNAATRFVGLVMSSREDDLATHLKQGGLNIKGGQLLRLVSIPVPKKCGTLPELHGYANVSALATAFNQHTARYFGTLAPPFLDYLVKHQTKLKASLPTDVMETANRLLAGLDGIPDQGMYDSVAKGFALVAVAGELAIEKDFLSWEKNQAFDAARECFQAWARHEQRASAMTDESVLRHLRKFFQSESASKFAPLSEFEASNLPHLAGYKHTVDGHEAFLVFRAYFESTVCEKFGRRAAIRVLKKLDLLVLGARGTPTRQITIPSDKRQDGPEKMSFYVIRDNIRRR